MRELGIEIIFHPQKGTRGQRLLTNYQNDGRFDRLYSHYRLG